MSIEMTSTLEASLPVLVTSRLEIRLAQAEDVPEVARFYVRNRDFFAPKEPTRPESFYSDAYWYDQVDRAIEQFFAGKSVRFFLFAREGSEVAETCRVLGSVGLTEIVRGSFEACYLGYALDQQEQGKGLMTEALEAVTRYAFEDLKLHRIMANYMPENHRSAAVLKRLGFVQEGLARDYLKIAGHWRDHVLTSLTRGSV